MSRDVQSLKRAFTMVRDFRNPQGRRYSLQAILMLTSLAMIDGAQSEQEVINWTEHEGQRWLNLIGIRRRRGPSLATLHRVLRGIDRNQLSEALTEIAGESVTEMAARPTAPVQEKENFHMLNDCIENLFVSRSDDEDDDDPQHISEAGLKIWGLNLERDSNAGRGL